MLIGSIYALMSIGLTLIFGVLRVVNFAHGEFLMFAMYGAWAISHCIGFNAYAAVMAVVPAMLPVWRHWSIGSSSARPQQAASGRGIRHDGAVDLHAERWR